LTAPALAGPKKAALVILGLDESVAKDVLKHFEEDDLRRLADHVDKLDPIPIDALDPAFEEFERRMRSPILPRGGGPYVRRLAAAALGEDRVRRLFAPPESPPQPIDAIKKARAATLAGLLEDEHPQLAAVILSQLSREQASEVLLAMPAEQQADLLGRIASLEEVPRAAVDSASEALARTLAATGGLEAGERGEFDGLAAAAALLNEMPGDASERLLSALAQADAALAPKIREAMFTFEDLQRLEGKALQVLMREVPAESMLLALKTASESVRERFLGAVSSRAAAGMREDLAAMPPMRLSDVERAQREIVEAATRLASEGRMVLPGASGERLV